MSDEPTAVALFSGAGGFSAGFRTSGYEIPISADINLDACRTYHHNIGRKPWNIDLSKPPRDFRQELQQVRGTLALIGGPPCQGFSSAGRKQYDDPRNRLINSFLQMVEIVQPRWFVFENVEGILTSQRGQSIHDLVIEFIKLGYTLKLAKVNFASYGLPQTRKRVILVGNRLGLPIEFPERTHSYDSGKHNIINSLPQSPTLDLVLAGLGQAVPKWRDSAEYLSSSPMSHYDEIMRQGNDQHRVYSHYSRPLRGRIGDAISILEPGQTMRDLPIGYWPPSYAARANRRVADGTPSEKRGGPPSGLKRLQGSKNSLTITSAATTELIHPTAIGQGRAHSQGVCKVEPLKSNHRAVSNTGASHAVKVKNHIS